MIVSLKTYLAVALTASAAYAAPYSDSETSDASILARGAGTPTSVNCGGRWGTIRRDTFNAWNKQFPVYTDGQKQICTGPHTCIQIPDGQKCVNTGYNFIQVGMCNDNDYGKCVDVPDVRTRLHQLTQHCADNSNNNEAGQAFYSDGTNFIVRTCPGQA